MDPSYIVVTRSACLGISPSVCSEDVHILFIPINNNQTFHFFTGFCNFAKWKSTSFQKSHMFILRWLNGWCTLEATVGLNIMSSL